MAYRTILVNLNDSARASILLDIAISLTKENDAHLIGLHAIPAVRIPPMTAAMEIPAHVFEAQRQEFIQEANKVRALFEEATAEDAISAEWRTAPSKTPQIGDKVLDHARCADLIIVSQGDPEGPDTGQADLPELLLMESGRPVLVIPTAGQFDSVGNYALVAWNASREAARAAFDATPILRKSKEVKILWVDPEKSSATDIEIAGSEIATSLSRKGIKVDAAHTMSGGVDIGNTLLSRVCDNGSDLLVMGGYGRSRLREYVFGGATHHVLQHMTVPVLMSH